MSNEGLALWVFIVSVGASAMAAVLIVFISSVERRLEILERQCDANRRNNNRHDTEALQQEAGINGIDRRLRIIENTIASDEDRADWWRNGGKQ